METSPLLAQHHDKSSPRSFVLTRLRVPHALILAFVLDQSTTTVTASVADTPFLPAKAEIRLANPLSKVYSPPVGRARPIGGTPLCASPNAR
jgi:hypothetical protein